MKILLGVTGSVAAIKTLEIFSALSAIGEVQVVATPSALKFFDPSTLPTVVHTEAEEWAWRSKGDPVLHIDLRQWLDVLVVAPLSANTLAKMAHGICDNLLLSVWLAASKKTTLVAPAMNTDMWEHPITQRNLALLQTAFPQRFRIIPPIEKRLACGDVGMGALAEITSIAAAVREELGRSREGSR